jgi:hypothetical protein
MKTRRHFLVRSLLAGVSWFSIPSARRNRALAGAGEQGPGPAYRVSRDVPTRRYDGKRCWCHPRAGIVPAAGKEGLPRVVMTMNTLDVAGSDVFKGMHGLHTDDLGRTWTSPREIANLAPREETIDGEKRPVAVSDFWPGWHAASNTLLGTGHTAAYTADWKVAHDAPRHTSYAVYNPKNDTWDPWRMLEMPDPIRFRNCGAGCTQRFDEADGTILLPVYFVPPDHNSRVAVVRAAFDGQILTYREHGNELAIDDTTRGLHEPSLTRFQGEYFLTVRHDQRACVSRSRDGLQFSPLETWKFDDGAELGSYNTQQHWVTHSDGLFLVYTRRGANNDHVFRHRAPLFMAQVDPRRLCVLRETEQILVPERGARLGNFGVTRVNEQETWVTVAEWMQTWGPNFILPVNNKYGSDGSVFVARIHWSTPNKSV